MKTIFILFLFTGSSAFAIDCVKQDGPKQRPDYEKISNAESCQKAANLAEACVMGSSSFSDTEQGLLYVTATDVCYEEIRSLNSKIKIESLSRQLNNFCNEEHEKSKSNSFKDITYCYLNTARWALHAGRLSKD